MRIMRTILAGALAVTLAAACSDSTAPADVTDEDLVGTWVATSVTFTPTGTSTPIDLLALGGGVTLVIGDDNTYSVTFTEPGGEPDVENGTYTVSAGVITITPTGSEESEALTIVSLDGNTLTLSSTAVEEVGEIEVSGTMRMVLEK